MRWSRCGRYQSYEIEEEESESERRREECVEFKEVHQDYRYWSLLEVMKREWVALRLRVKRVW